MKKKLLVLLSVTTLVVGMSEPSGVPPEVRNIKARVEDSKGVVHELSSFRCGSGAHMRFKKGSATYTIPLTSIKTFSVLGVRDGKAEVEVALKSGKREKLTISSSTICSGVADSGAVEIYVSDIKKVELKGESK